MLSRSVPIAVTIGVCLVWTACGVGGGTSGSGTDGGTDSTTDSGRSDGSTSARDGSSSTDATSSKDSSGSVGTGGMGGSAGAGGAAGSGGSGGAGSTEGSAGAGGAGGSGGSAGAGGAAGSGGSAGDGGTPVNVLTNRYNNARTGANTNETLLTTSNVNTTSFGFKFSSPVTGRIYGQPLYVSDLTVGGTSHNVVYAATEHNMVYAFDADNGAQLWARALEPPAILGSGNGATFNPGCADMGSGASNYEVGITSTPVIDPTAKLIYVVAKTTGKQMLHALSLTTGNDGPTPTQVGPSGFSSDDTPLNRPGLLLFNGVVYVAFGSHCDSCNTVCPYHGWIFGQNATTLTLTSTYNVTPSGSEGAIWQGGTGLSSDGSNIWFSAGNGTTGGDNVAMSVVEVTPSGNVLQSHSENADGDNDLTAGAVLVSSSGNDYVLSGGKSGYVVLLDATNVSNNPQLIGAGGEVQNVATWNGGAAGQFVYTWGTSAPLYAWQLTGGTLTAQQTYNLSSGNPGHPGGMVTVSSNGTTADTGVLWALLPTSGDAWHSTAPGALYAFDATNIANVLWNSNSDGTPLTPLGTYAKFSPPTVANGKVYCASFPSSTAEGATGELMVYGLK